MSRIVGFPEKYHLATQFVDKEWPDLEKADKVDESKRLGLYALRQQADVGPNTQPAPYMWNITARAKHSAWAQLNAMSKMEAMVFYTQLLDELRPKWLEQVLAVGAAPGAASESPTDQPQEEREKRPDAASASAAESTVHDGANHNSLPPPPRLPQPPPTGQALTAAGDKVPVVADSPVVRYPSSSTAEVMDPAACFANASLDDFDDTTLRSDVSPANVAYLLSEVLRLRRLCRSHGINPAAPPVQQQPSQSELRSLREGGGGGGGRNTRTPSVSSQRSSASAPHNFAVLEADTDLPARHAAASRGWMQWLGLASEKAASNHVL